MPSPPLFSADQLRWRHRHYHRHASGALIIATLNGMTLMGVSYFRQLVISWAVISYWVVLIDKYRTSTPSKCITTIPLQTEENSMRLKPIVTALCAGALLPRRPLPAKELKSIGVTVGI